jgi:hypothetical protein
MFRDSKDVMKVFVNKLVGLLNKNNADHELAESLVHLILQDLTSPDMNKKLIYLTYHTVINCEQILFDGQAIDKKVALIENFRDIFYT